MFGVNPGEFIIVAIVAILLFGKRLPEVAKSLGKSYRDLRQGLQDIQSQFHDIDREYRSAATTVRKSFDDDNDRSTAPRFDPPPSSAPPFQPPIREPQSIAVEQPAVAPAVGQASQGEEKGL